MLSYKNLVILHINTAFNQSLKTLLRSLGICFSCTVSLLSELEGGVLKLGSLSSHWYGFSMNVPQEQAWRGVMVNCMCQLHRATGDSE